MMLPILDPVAGSASGEAAGIEDPVLSELWISFVSLLRSHLGALQTTGKLAQAEFVMLSEGEIEIVDLARTLHVSLQTASGSGEWGLRRMGEMIAAGAWTLHSDATASLDQGRLQDMELAVEALVEKLWSRMPQRVSIAGDQEAAG